MYPVQVKVKPNPFINTLGKFHFVSQADRQSYRCDKLVFLIANACMLDATESTLSFVAQTEWRKNFSGQFRNLGVN